MFHVDLNLEFFDQSVLVQWGRLVADPTAQDWHIIEVGVYGNDAVMRPTNVIIGPNSAHKNEEEKSLHKIRPRAANTT